MSDLRLLIALNSWGIIDSALLISMLLILAWGLIVFTSTKLHQHKKLVYYFWGRWGIAVDCSKGILYETVAFQHLVRLVKDAAQTWNYSVAKLWCGLLLHPPTKTRLTGPQNKIILMFGGFAVLRPILLLQTQRFHTTLRLWCSILLSTFWL